MPVDISKLTSAVVFSEPSEIRKVLGKKERLQALGIAECEDCDKSTKYSAGQEKSLGVPGKEKLKELMEKRGITPSDELYERMIPYFASDERVDSDGDIVKQNWHFGEFEVNSPMPFSHGWNMPPVGRVLDWRVTERKEASYSGPALWLLGMFATKQDWVWADTIFRLVKSGIMPSGSVGFHSTKVIDVKDHQEREELGLGRWGLILDENHLLEFSPVTVPANPGVTTLQSLKKIKNSLLPHDIHMIRELYRESIYSSGKVSSWKKVEGEILVAAKALWPDRQWEFHRDLDVPVILDNYPEDDVIDSEKSSLEKLQEQIDDLSAELRGKISDIESKVEAPRGSLPLEESRLEKAIKLFRSNLKVRSN